MLLSQELTEGVAVLAVHGPIAGADAPTPQAAVDSAVDESPRGVVIDLTDAGPLAAAAGEEVSMRAVVPCGPQGPGAARRLALECARTHGFDGDDLALVVTELVTNAVRHGAPPVGVEIDTCGRWITVVVSDASTARPVPRVAGDDDEGGRGLLLVDLLTVDRGVRSSRTGKAVWAELPWRAAQQ